MRKCLRCGLEMKENCAIKIEGQDMELFSLPMKINCLEGEWENPKSRYVLKMVRYLFILKI